MSEDEPKIENIEELPFEKSFSNGEREIVVACDIDGGLLQLIDTEQGNNVTLHIDWEGKIKIVTTNTLSGIIIDKIEQGVDIYDTITMHAELKHEGALEGDVADVNDLLLPE